MAKKAVTVAVVKATVIVTAVKESVTTFNHESKKKKRDFPFLFLYINENEEVYQQMANSFYNTPGHYEKNG